MRQKYDRHSVVADPGAAVSRAALNAVGWGLSTFWRMGEQAIRAGLGAGLGERGDGNVNSESGDGKGNAINVAKEQRW